MKSKSPLSKFLNPFITVLIYLPQPFLLLVLAVAVPLRALYRHLRLMSVPPSQRDPSKVQFDIICLSHVPWSHIWQRNHHTMSRLAQNHKVVYFQTTSIAYIHWFVRMWTYGIKEYFNSSPTVKLVYPLLFPGQSRLPAVARLNRWLMTTELRWMEYKAGLQNTVLWFYYPAAAHVLDQFNPAAVVYDIQDEYTAFDWSPGDIAERESYLIDRANIIFAGTHALYERKTQGFQGKAYFYPCAVEFSHFFAAAPRFDQNFFAQHPQITPEAAQRIRHICTAFVESGANYGTVSNATPDAGKPTPGNSQLGAGTQVSTSECGGIDLEEPARLKKLRRPRLLYVGLIDKRIDPDLLVHLGQSHPEWEIVMVGPVDEKLFDDEAVSNAAPNVIFTGSEKYQNLAPILAHCDVYLMPWKVNHLTRHINPTKTLEYMAAARPVVSISLPDLENLFSDSVNLATNYEEFVHECEASLRGERWDKVARGLDRAWSFAWETVVREMEEHVGEAIRSDVTKAKSH